MPRGGRRPGAGRKKDTTSTRHERLVRSIEKEVLREQARAIIAPHLTALLTVHIANAQGLKYLVTRDKKTGKFIRVGPAMAGQVGEETIEVWEKDPSVQALTVLLDRLLDRAKEQEQAVVVKDERSMFDRVAKARERLRVSGG